MLVEPMHRGILAADIEGFGRLERSNPVRSRLRAALHRLIDQSLAHAGIERWRWEATDHGDCVLVLLEPLVSKTRLLHPFVPKLASALARHNRGAPPAERLRLRVVVHAGEILRDAHGHSGEDLNAAFRLLDSDALRTHLAGAAGDLALIVSDAIYQAIVKHAYGRIDPAGFQQVTVVAKETNVKAWVHTPLAPGRSSRARGPRTAVPRSVAARSRRPPPAAAPPASVATQLPPDVASFTGRHRELRRLRDLLGTGSRRPAPVVCAIHGIGGVGKSALAVHAGHALAGRFPDGQLYADLGGPGAALAPQEVIGRFLRALGVDGERVPVMLEEAVARLRALLGGRRVLVVLDNAASATQIAPLLPATAGSSALITSRQVLVALDSAVHLPLDVLSPKASVTLLRRLLGAKRVAAEPAAAALVARRCGHLPLALRIAAARLAARPSWTLQALAEQLADERHRLDHLQLGDLAVRASFQLSYQALLDAPDGALAARTFRLLGLLDGPDASVEVVAALADRPPERVASALERLADAQLLGSPVPGRYRIHDLLRLFAREQADRHEPAADRRAARHRALRHYLAATQRASRLVQPPELRRGRAPQDGAAEPADRGPALAWLETERGNLVAAAQQAAAEPGRLANVAVGIASALFWFLQTRGYWRDWETLNRLAVEVTRRLDDRKGESQSLSDLAGTYHRLGRADEAVACLEQALRIHRTLGDRTGEQVVLSNLGIAYRVSGRLDEATACCKASLSLARAAGDRYGEAVALNSLGKIYRKQHQLESAIASYTGSLSIFAELGDAYGQGNALANLGEVYVAAGRAGAGVDHCRRALTLFRQVGDRLGEAEALTRMGTALDALGQPDQARTSWRDALAIFSAIGDPKARDLEVRLRGDAGNAPAPP